MSLSANQQGGISERGTYGEMRAHYMAWKFLLKELDYVGFQHYRRWLFLPALYYDDIGSAYFDDSVAFDNYVAAAIPPPDLELDVIVAQRWHFPRTIGEEYAASHVGAHWEAMLEEWPEARLLAADERSYNVCNIFIARVAVFRAYMEFWWNLVQRIEVRIEIPSDPYQSRAMAFLSERIFSLWLKQRREELVIAEVPLIMDTSRAA